MTTIASHPAFEFIRHVPIAALNIEVQEFKHIATGAIHYHMQADNPENVFMVALRTVPMDHKGVAHILEHTALCGSERFPVRDPFFMMIRRSLNTFMNAMTSNDWTAYPFASQNRKDFNNLLDVYLDAVFFSRLDELDFLQEGHRLEFTEEGNTDSDLTYKGVVFNEMKGAMSSVSSTLWQTLCSHLFSSTTYHYNSGGDPAHITDLSYQELKDFYQDHYHPSNAMFLTFGDIPAAQHQQTFEEKALSKFSALDDSKAITIGREKRITTPVTVQEAYAFDSSESTDKQSHIVIGWLLGQNTNLKDMLTAKILSYVLLENSASPMQHYLETTDLGTAPSPLCGLEDSYHELVFVCGIAGSEAEHAEQFEKDILALLEKVATEGVSLTRMQAIVHQLELSQREIGGDGYPYGLQLLMTALPSITHRGDPISLLDLEPVLADLRESIKDPEYIKTVVKELLLDNKHRVRLLMTPDKELSQTRTQAETDKLAAIKAQLSDAEKQAIVDKTAALKQRQQQEDDADILPKVTLADVPETLNIAKGSQSTINQTLCHEFQQGTNGLVYQQLILPLPALSDELLSHLPLYSQCLTELGLGDKDFTHVQMWQSEVVGSISAFSSLRGAIDNEQEILAYFIFSAKALNRNQQDMAELLKATLETIHFDETSRIRDMVSQTRTRKEQSVTGSGHVMAMACASSLMSPLAKLNNSWGGLNSIQTIKALDDKIADEKELNVLIDKLKQIHTAVLAMPMQVLSIAEKDQFPAIQQTIKQLWPAHHTEQNRFKPEAVREQVREAWMVNSQVNFCAKSYPTVPVEHDDSAALTVLGNFLSNGFLHSNIREAGGAYGGGAGQDSNIAAFRFYSYRDPRLTETLNDFDAAINWMKDNSHKPAQLEEAILGVISSLDKPASPAGEAKQAFHNDLFGRSESQRQAFRHRILAVKVEDLIRVSETYLKPENASIAVISNKDSQSELEALGLELHSL
ncbi:MAG: insulinase family protein [Pseudomonadales bacterium]|nr:insulinase family protein [Pseudomonadales bacterium]